MKQFVSFTGTTEMTKKLREVAKQMPQRVGGALYVEAQIEMTESKKRCPVAPDGGTLRASGQVAEPEYEGRKISVTMSYGGAASAYAIAVHEHLSESSPHSWVVAEHNGDGVRWSVPGTGPKFLESVLNESSPHMIDRLGERLKFGTGKELE